MPTKIMSRVTNSVLEINSDLLLPKLKSHISWYGKLMDARPTLEKKLKYKMQAPDLSGS